MVRPVCPPCASSGQERAWTERRRSSETALQAPVREPWVERPTRETGIPARPPAADKLPPWCMPAPVSSQPLQAPGLLIQLPFSSRPLFSWKRMPRNRVIALRLLPTVLFGGGARQHSLSLTDVTWITMKCAGMKTLAAGAKQPCRTMAVRQSSRGQRRRLGAGRYRQVPGSASSDLLAAEQIPIPFLNSSRVEPGCSWRFRHSASANCAVLVLLR